MAPRSSTPKRSKKKADGGGDAVEERVNVVVRIRPQLRADEGGADNMSLQVDLQRDMVWALGADEEGDKPGGKAPRQFIFDRVIPPEGKQEDVYDAAAVHVVRAVIDGFTGCVMCYGQTGAGKTYTLANERAGPDAGVMIRAFSDIFDHITEDAEHSYEVQMAYVQVYLESLSDLLQPENDVQIREDSKTGVFLTGLNWRSVQSVQGATAVLADGNRNRATASTSMNADSSRSHAVLMMHITRRGGTRTLLGKLYLVDLAGSERVKRSGVEGQSLDEAIAINQSLTTLGRCIEAMARGKKGDRPPFRDSKLTRLLSSAIGGNAKTTLIVCVAPSKRDMFETQNSLEFGQQAMNVVVRAKVNATVDYGGLATNLMSQLDAKQSSLHRLENRVLQQLASEHETVLALEREAKAAMIDAKEAQAEAALSKKELQQIQDGETEAKREAEVRKTHLVAERQARTAELAQVMAGLKDTPELRRIRQKQEEEKRVLTRQLQEVQTELERAQDAAKAAGAGAALEKGGDALESEKELLVGVAKNLGNLALHFVRADALQDAQPLVSAAQNIFESVLGEGHPDAAAWKTDMMTKIQAVQDQSGARQGSEANGHGGQRGTAAGFPVARFLEAFANPRRGAEAAAVDDITQLLGSFTNPREPQSGGATMDMSINMSARGGPADDDRRRAREHVLRACARPVREGDGRAEADALEAIRHFFIAHGNGPDAIVEFHRLVYSARTGSGAIDADQAYGKNYNDLFVQTVDDTFSARGSARGSVRSFDGLSSGRTTGRTDVTVASTVAGGASTTDAGAGGRSEGSSMSKAEAKQRLLQVAGTPRRSHLSTQTPRNEAAAEQALRDFLQAYGEGDEALEELHKLVKSVGGEDMEQGARMEVREIVAGNSADQETSKRRIEATSKLLQVAGTPRGQHLSQQTPRDVLHAEAALQEFIQAHGGGSEGLAALQQLMPMVGGGAGTGSSGSGTMAPARSAVQPPAPPPPPPPPPPAPKGAMMLPRDPPATKQGITKSPPRSPARPVKANRPGRH